MPVLVIVLAENKKALVKHYSLHTVAYEHEVFHTLVHIGPLFEEYSSEAHIDKTVLMRSASANKHEVDQRCRGDSHHPRSWGTWQQGESDIASASPTTPSNQGLDSSSRMVAGAKKEKPAVEVRRVVPWRLSHGYWKRAPRMALRLGSMVCFAGSWRRHMG